MRATPDVLDRVIPLVGASHRNVVDYSIVIPMRYAECVAELQDGTRARFRDPRQLLGWFGPVRERTFFFTDGKRAYVIRTDGRRRVRVREVQELAGFVVGDAAEGALDGKHGAAMRTQKLIARDGSLLHIGHSLPRPTEQRTRIQATESQSSDAIVPAAFN